MADMKPITWIVIALVALLVISPGARDWAMDLIPSTEPAQVTGPGGAQKCYIEDTTLTLGPSQERYNPTTKVTTDYHRLFKNGVDKGLYVDGSTVTVNPGDSVEIIYAENSSSYYAAKQEFTVPCAGEVTAGEAPDSDAYKLFAKDANNMTKRVFNEDNGNLNAATDNETLAAGDVVNLNLQLIGTYEDAWSPYGNQVVLVEANDTVYKDFALGQYSSTTCPGQHSVGNVDEQTWCFSLPGTRSNEQIDTTVMVEVESGVNPQSTGGAEIDLYFYDSDYFMNTDSGIEEIGVENNDDSDVGFAASKKTVYVK